MSAPKRFMISISTELDEGVQAIKKDLFYNKSYAEMYRQLIQIGIDEVKKRNDLAKHTKI